MCDINHPTNGKPVEASASPATLRAAVLAFRRNMYLLRCSLVQGDLTMARASFAALQSIAPAAPKGVTMRPREVGLGTLAYVALYRALQEGDMEGARGAFLRLLQSLRSHPPAKPRHRRTSVLSVCALPTWRASFS